jgi:predicted ATPase
MRRVLDKRFIAAIRLQRDQIPCYKEYPFCIPAIRNLKRLVLHPKVTFLVGENGIGKSTLVEAIAVKMGFNPEGGSRNFRFETRVSHSKLHQFLTVERGVLRPTDGYFLRAESFYNLATEIEKLDGFTSEAPPIIKSYGGNSLHEQSHGESFFSLLLNRLSGHGLYIFDEPEAALSPSRQMSVLTLIHQLVATGSQFIISTHSPILMAYPHSQIYHLSEKGIKKVDYKETDHYQITRDFLNRHEKMLEILLKE